LFSNHPGFSFSLILVPVCQKCSISH